MARFLLFIFFIFWLTTGSSQHTESKEFGQNGNVKSISTWIFDDIDRALIDQMSWEKSSSYYFWYRHFNTNGHIDSFSAKNQIPNTPELNFSINQSYSFTYDSTGTVIKATVLSNKILHDTLPEFESQIWEYNWFNKFGYIVTRRDAETNLIDTKAISHLDQNFRVIKYELIRYSDDGKENSRAETSYEYNRKGLIIKSTSTDSYSPGETTVKIYENKKFDQYDNPTLIVTISTVNERVKISVMLKEYEYYE